MSNSQSQAQKKRVSTEKQFELMYADVVQVTGEVKRAIFDLVRWVVTLQGLIVGFAVLRDIQVSLHFVWAPVLIGVSSLILLHGFQSELDSHRKTLAILRDEIDDHVGRIHHEHIQTHLHGNATLRSYWSIIRNGHRLIILGTTIASVLIILDAATGRRDIFETY